ncbi:MAG: CBS domain-containing protein [Bacteroidales bacterium]
MIATDIISDEMPSVKTSDTGLEALNWMTFFKVSHIPIVNNKIFLGLLSENDIYDLNNPEEPIGNHNISLHKAYVLPTQHIYEILEIASRLKLTVIPVVNDSNEYIGIIKLTDLIHEFAKVSAIEKPGGIIVLEVHVNDYSVSEISQIIESNNAKVLSLYIHTIPDSVRIEVHIKVNVSDITSILQTFNRYEYEVKASHLEMDKHDDLYNSRYELLMRYLNP